MHSKLLIYGLVDPRTGAIRYIGKSSSGRSRPTKHKYLRRDDRSYKANWIRQLQAISLDYEILVLEYCSDITALDAAEIRWIALGRQFVKLTNVEDGGTHARVGLETRFKIGAAHRGRKASPETRAKMSRSRLGKPHTREHSAKIAESLRGRSHTAERCANISAANLGKKHSVESRMRNSAAKLGKKRKPFTDQHLVNLSAAQRESWARRKAAEPNK